MVRGAAVEGDANTMGRSQTFRKIYGGRASGASSSVEMGPGKGTV